MLGSIIASLVWPLFFCVADCRDANCVDDELIKSTLPSLTSDIAEVFDLLLHAWNTK